MKPAKKVLLRIALAQLNPTVGDLEGNAQKIREEISRARETQADLVLFPEQVIPGYPAEDLLLKNQFVRDDIIMLKSLQPTCKGLTAVLGFIDKGKDGSLYNAAAVMHDAQYVATYHKIHLPNYGVFDEKRYFTPGKRPLLLNLQGILVGINICEDVWVRDGPTGILTRAGAQVVLNISASPYHMLKAKEREAMLSSRARAHNIWIVYTNMVGGQDEIVFDGQSLVINPKGRIVSRAKAFQEDMSVVDIPLEVQERQTRSADKSQFSVVMLGPCKSRTGRVRKPVAPIIQKHLPLKEELFRALVLGTKDYVRKNGFQKVVLGLSGGVDSSLVAAIAAEALGADNVVALFMPSRFSSVQSHQDAAALAQNLKIRLDIVGIDTVYESYLANLRSFFQGLPVNITEENLQARIRGNVLMAFSNKFGWLVLTTGNKSETSVGYCTLYGDMAGGFAVIKDLFKDWVYRLAGYINERAGKEIIPNTVLIKEPTAELRPNQKDSDSIPPYPTLDPILKGYIEQNMGVDDLTRKGFSPALVKQIVEMVDRNEYKRRQAPPGVKITPLAFGKDRRYPITNRYHFPKK